MVCTVSMCSVTLQAVQVIFPGASGDPRDTIKVQIRQDDGQMDRFLHHECAFFTTGGLSGFNDLA